MIEWIREFIMKRWEKMRDKCERLWEWKMICPKIRGILDKNMEESSNCMSINSDHFCRSRTCLVRVTWCATRSNMKSMLMSFAKIQ
ncbi:hypothetical protein ACS0TY_014542 [Phlomoides rotata]